MTGYSRILLLAAIGLAALLALPGAVLADGDPASDYLISQTAFLPIDSNVGTTQAGALTRLLTQEQKAGFPIRVAVIARKVDLGADSVLYRRPQYYATFLGEEISYWYRQELLVVMPNGYGIEHDGKVPPADVTALSRLPKPNTTAGDALVVATEQAVQALARAHGINLEPTQAAPPAAAAPGETNPGWVIAILTLVVIGTPIAAFVAVRGQWRREARDSGVSG